MSKILNLNITVAADELINLVARTMKRNSLSDQYFDNNQGRFISCQAGGILYSMCFHQTRQHSAICEVHNNFKKMFGAEDKIVRSAKSTAPPGQWAIAYCDSGRFGGDKTDFEIL